jgi:capsular exopolysaccharide synthesis family protein
MEAETHAGMDLRAYWFIIRRWWWLILLAAVLAGASAYVVSRYFTTPEYQATTRLLVQPSSATSGVGYQDVLAGQQVALTYAELLRSESISQEALHRLDARVAAGSTPAYKQPLAYSVEVQRLQDTGILELRVVSTDPRLAADLAAMIAGVFIEQSSQRQSARFAASKDALNKQMSSVEDDIARVKSQLAQSYGDARASLEAQLAQLQDTLARLNGSYQGVQLAEIQSVDLITVAEPAKVPEAPVRPNVLQNVLLATTVGVLLGVGVAFLIEYLDTRIRGAEQAEAATQSTVLGQVWYTPELARGSSNGSRLLLHDEHSPIGESFRLLRVNLHFASVDRPLRSLLVASAMPDEGKSVLALNLAAALAESGQRVVLLDADLRRSTLSRYTGVSQQPGLTDALFDRQGNLQKYLYPVPEARNLWIVPAGIKPPDPHELLASQRMAEFVQQLGTLTDTLIVDSPPLLAVADAAVLAEKVEAALLVLEAGATDRRAAAAAAEQLRRSSAVFLGVVLNKAPLGGRGDGSYKQYYYYYYYYDHYSRPNGRPPTLWQRLWPPRRQKKHRRRLASGPRQRLEP